jgi:cytochrome P450
MFTIAPMFGDLIPSLGALLAERRAAIEADAATVPPDILTRLIRTVLPAELGFGDERLLINAASLLLGFVENAAGSMTNLVEQLLLRPELRLTEVAADPAGCDPHVWEALRFNPFLKLISRVCESDHPLAAGTPRETVIPAGTLVLAATASAMFDAEAVAEPETFRTDRPGHTRLHFGTGHHSCVAGHVGAVVIAETVRRLLLRDPWLLPLPGGGITYGADGMSERFVLGVGGRK